LSFAPATFGQDGGMENPLANPLDVLAEKRGAAPDTVWKLVGASAGIVGGIGARKLLDAIRHRVSRRGDVPLNPGHERMSWPYALIWAGLIGVGASLGRLVAQRVVAAVWTRRQHRPVAAMPT
jgi:hypothetical protein